MAKQSRSKKAPRKARAAKTSPVKAPRKAAGKPAKAPKAARKAKAAPKAREPRKAAPRAAKAPRKAKAPKAPRARKVRPPKPVEVYGHDAPYNCDDPFVKEPVRLRVCRPDPRKPSRRKCDVREFVVEGCATPGPGRRAKQMYVVPHTHQYLAPAREVARARVMPLPDNGDCADARFAHAHGRSIGEGSYGACGISEASEAGLTVDPASISFPNGYGRARGQMARGSRRNPPLLVPGRNYRWASPHGGSGVVTYLSGDGRTARVSLNGSVFGVPTRELLPMGADIGVGYPMTFPNGADAVDMGTSPTFLPPPKSDPHIGKRVFGKNVQGMVRGVARCGEKGPRQYVVGGQIVSRARVASSLRREKLMAEGNWPPPRRARSAPQVVPAPMPRRERAPEVMGPAWSPPPPRIMLPPPERIIEAQVVETRPARAPSAQRGKAKQTTMALDAPLSARAPDPLLTETRAVLARAGYNPSDADVLSAEGIGPDEVRARIGTLETTHGLRRAPAPQPAAMPMSAPASQPVVLTARAPAARSQRDAYEFMFRVNSERLARINAMLYKLEHTKAPAAAKAAARIGLVDAQTTAEVVIDLSHKLDPDTQGREFEERAKGVWMNVDPVFFASDIHTPAELLGAIRDAKRRRSKPTAAGASAADVEGRVQEALEMFLGSRPSKPMVRALAEAIATGQYTGVLSPGQKHARSAFEYLTGVALPNTVHGTVDVFRGRPFPVVV
jgi:hypothetical protein